MDKQKQKDILILADMIQGEINRMIVTDDINELDKMSSCAIYNIKILYALRAGCYYKGEM